MMVSTLDFTRRSHLKMMFILERLYGFFDSWPMTYVIQTLRAKEQVRPYRGILRWQCGTLAT